MDLKKLFRHKKKKIEEVPDLKWSDENPIYEEADNGGSNPLFDNSDEIPYDPNAPEDKMTEKAKNDDIEVSEPFDVFQNSFFASPKGRNELFQLRSLLSVSEKGGVGHDSEKYQRVNDLLLRIEVDQTSKKFGEGTADQDIENLTNMSGLYSQLIEACDTYLNRKAHTKAGKARRAIVSSVKNIAKRDIRGLHQASIEVSSAGKAERSKMTWNELLKIARTDKYVVPKLKVAEGGQASEVYKFDNPDKSSNVKKLFFKPETTLDYKDSFGTWIIGKYREIHPDEKIDKDTLDAFKRLPYRRSAEIQFRDPKDKAAAEKLKDYASAKAIAGNLHSQMFDVFGSMNIKSGKQDVAGRNVASSRVAELLGVGNILAKSTFAEIDDGKGNKRKGIVMEGVEGIEAKEWQRQTAIGAMAHNEGLEGFEDESYSYDKWDNFHGKDDIMQPSFLRDISTLQVLDSLCGQVDRHGGNFFLQSDTKGRLIGVKGIDNDSAFGNNTDAVVKEDFARKDRSTYDENGNLAIPHIDAALAERIKALTPEALRLALSDIIGTREIDSAIIRLNKLKEAIRNAKEGQILENESDWGTAEVKKNMLKGHTYEDETALQDELVASGMEMGDAIRASHAAGTYLSNMTVHDFHLNGSYAEWKKERAKKNAQAK